MWFYLFYIVFDSLLCSFSSFLIYLIIFEYLIALRACRHRALDSGARQPTNRQLTNQKTSKATSQLTKKPTNQQTNKATNQHHNKQEEPRWSPKPTQKQPKNQSKIYQNHHYENPSKIDQKTIKNHPKSQKCRGAPGLPRDNFAPKSRPEPKIHALRLGSRLGCVLEASWARLGGQDSSKLDSKIEGKSIKNPCKNRSKIQCLPSSSFYAILMDFWSENEGMLAPKSDQKSMPTSKGDFLKKRGFTLAKTIILEVLGVEVESKNPSKINQKSIKN